MALLLSIFLALLPLAGIGYIILNGSFTTDALFMSLILLAMAAIFLLNAFMEARSRGLILRRRSQAQKTS